MQNDRKNEGNANMGLVSLHRSEAADNDDVEVAVQRRFNDLGFML